MSFHVGEARRDVDHDEARQAVGVVEGEAHGYFAAHAVAQQRGIGAKLEVVEQGQHVLRHQGVAVLGRMERAAVVAQIYADDAQGGFGGPAARQALPVVEGAEQAVENNQRAALALVEVVQ